MITCSVLTIPPDPELLLLAFDVLDEGDKPKMSFKKDEELKSATDNGANWGLDWDSGVILTVLFEAIFQIFDWKNFESIGFKCKKS